jgi:hypothetical protein
LIVAAFITTLPVMVTGFLMLFQSRYTYPGRSLRPESSLNRLT